MFATVFEVNFIKAVKMLFQIIIAVFAFILISL